MVQFGRVVSHFLHLLAVRNLSCGLDHFVVNFLAENAALQVVGFSEPNVEQVEQKERDNKEQQHFDEDLEDLPV